MPNEARASWSESAQAWIDHIRQGTANRIGLLDPVMLAQIELCDPQTLVDVGCGEGRFCRQLTGRQVVGLDPTEALISSAKAKDPDGTYLQSEGERLPFRDESFEMAVSYLVLLDIPDFRRAIAEMVRVVKLGGHLLIANINPFATTSAQGWLLDENGNRLYIPVDNYNDEVAHLVEWSGIKIVNYHRPLQDYMQAFLSNGLQLRAFFEPRPTPEALERWPSLGTEERVPYFHVMLWQKPCHSKF